MAQEPKKYTKITVECGSKARKPGRHLSRKQVDLMSKILLGYDNSALKQLNMDHLCDKLDEYFKNHGLDRPSKGNPGVQLSTHNSPKKSININKITKHKRGSPKRTSSSKRSSSPERKASLSESKTSSPKRSSSP